MTEVIEEKRLGVLLKRRAVTRDRFNPYPLYFGVFFFCFCPSYATSFSVFVLIVIFYCCWFIIFLFYADSLLWVEFVVEG